MRTLNTIKRRLNVAQQFYINFKNTSLSRLPEQVVYLGIGTNCIVRRVKAIEG